MSNIRYVLTCCLMFILTIVPGNAHAAPGAGTAPNILLILVDDVGYADIGCLFCPHQ